jgi:hypothetical protein
MPVHDWTRVNAGIFHHFHVRWLTELSDVLNDGLLPPDYYALAEQVASDLGPDVLTLQANGAGGPSAGRPPAGGTAVLVAPPKVRFTATAEMDVYAQRQRFLAIHHSSDDRVVAIIEILSPGNKGSRDAWRKVIDKAVHCLARNVHLLLLDLLPHSPRDPQGVHGAVWAEISDIPYAAPVDKRLTLVSYSAGLVKKAYIEPVAVGDVLPDMPLFLDPESYVLVPLESAYLRAWQHVPQRWRRVIEGQPVPPASGADPSS